MKNADFLVRSNKNDDVAKGTNQKIKDHQELGFSLIEAVCAMVILLIALVGVFTSFTYAVNYNAGNNSRAQALAILQQEIEQLRSKKFTPAPDGLDTELIGGEKPEKIVTLPDNNKFRVKVTVDNNPATAAIEGEAFNTTMKQITITVTLDRPTPGWQTSVPATAILRRVRAN